MPGAGKQYVERAREADNSDKLNNRSASATPADDTIPISGTGQPLLDKGWLPPVAIFQEQKSSNTNGGGASAGLWYQRPLNTTVVNDITGCSLDATGLITLPAGTYDVEAWAMGHKIDSHQVVLWNQDDSSVELPGSSEHSAASDSTATRSYIIGRFTIAAEKDVKLRHYSQTARATDAWGVGINNSTTEVFSSIKLTKVA